MYDQMATISGKKLEYDSPKSFEKYMYDYCTTYL